jgi:hypothetical protein
MVAMNKETMMMVALVVALISVFNLYRETQKTKLDLKKLLETPVPAPPAPKPILKKEKVQIPATSTAAAVADEAEQ